jgi:hypothetical protein
MNANDLELSIKRSYAVFPHPAGYVMPYPWRLECYVLYNTGGRWETHQLFETLDKAMRRAELVAPFRPTRIRAN